ncbi:hypothetical protein ACB092_03G047400 [Castanea dentata]
MAPNLHPCTHQFNLKSPKLEKSQFASNLQKMSIPVELVLWDMSVEDVENPTRIADVSIVKGRNQVLLKLTTPIPNESPKAFRIDFEDAQKGSLTLVTKLKTGGELDSNILIGEVRVNIKELMDQTDGKKSYFTYPITAPSGEVTIGALMFSVEFKGYVPLSHPTSPPYNPPYPAPQPRRPSFGQRLATHLGVASLIDSIRNGFDFDFDTDFGDVGSFF